MSGVHPFSFDEVLADLQRRIHDLSVAANAACHDEQERSRDWCQRRMRRFEDESRPLRRKMDAMLHVKAKLDGAHRVVHVIPVDNPTILSSGMRAALEADGEKLRGLSGEDHGPFEPIVFPW